MHRKNSRKITNNFSQSKHFQRPLKHAAYYNPNSSDSFRHMSFPQQKSKYSIATRIPPGRLRCLDACVSKVQLYDGFILFIDTFSKIPTYKIYNFTAIFMFLSCDVCETSCRATGWPGQGLEGVPRMSLH